MNIRERFHRVMNFKKVDRLPMIEWASWWDKTIDNWKQEGLEIKCNPPLNESRALMQQFGLDLHFQLWVNIQSPLTPKPAWRGAPIVSTIKEYKEILPTLYPETPFDPDMLRIYKRYQDSGEAIFWLTLIGPFWGPRYLLGIEPHMYAFYDEPELMHLINKDIAVFNLRVIDQVCDLLTPDFMTFAEDMSYNKGPMISESLFNEFLLPCYKLQIPTLKKRGVRVFIDSDGNISDAIQWFKNAGIEGILPLERQSGVDIADLRRKHPDFLFIGHFDKLCMNKGEEAIRAEFERLLPVMRQGGFIPSVDHQTPPEVSLEDYMTYFKLLKEYVQKAASDV